METLSHPASTEVTRSSTRRGFLTLEAIRPPEQDHTPDMAAVFAFGRELQTHYPTEANWVDPNNRVVSLYDRMIKSGFLTCPVQPLKKLLEKPLVEGEPRSTVLDYLMYCLQAMQRFDQGEQIVWQDGNPGLTDLNIVKSVANNEELRRRLVIPPSGTYPAKEIEVRVGLPGLETIAYGKYVEEMLRLIYDTSRFSQFGFSHVEIRPGTKEERAMGGFSDSRETDPDRIAILFPGDFGVDPSYWMQDVTLHEIIHQLATAFGVESGADDMTLSELLELYNSYFGLVASNHPALQPILKLVRNHELYGDSKYAIRMMGTVFDAIHTRLDSTELDETMKNALRTTLASEINNADVAKALTKKLEPEDVRKSRIVDTIMTFYGKNPEFLKMLGGEYDQALYQSYYFHHETISFLASKIIQDSALQKEGGLHEDPLLIDFANKVLALGRNNMTVDELNAGLYKQAHEVGLGEYYSDEWAWWPFLRDFGKVCFGVGIPALCIAGPIAWIINRKMAKNVKATRLV